MSVSAGPQLLEAIEAMPVGGTGTSLVTDYGNTFSKAGLGNRMRAWCDAADLRHCIAHGLRKALATFAANEGSTNRQLRALSGWKTDS